MELPIRLNRENLSSGNPVDRSNPSSANAAGPSSWNAAKTNPPSRKAIRKANPSSVNAVKKRIRDTKRQLEHFKDLPANIKVDNERALAIYAEDLSAALDKKTYRKMVKRYHMVRFFERQKATRNFRRIRKQLLEAKTTDEVEDIKVQLHIAEVDLNYTQYFPLNERYVSLFAKGTDMSKKPEKWAIVEKCMENGTLEQLRDNKKRDESGFKSQTPVSSSTMGSIQPDATSGNAHIGSKARRTPDASQSTIKDDEGHESDLGFFEE